MREKTKLRPKKKKQAFFAEYFTEMADDIVKNFEQQLRELALDYEIWLANDKNLSQVLNVIKNSAPNFDYARITTEAKNIDVLREFVSGNLHEIIFGEYEYDQRDLMLTSLDSKRGEQ